MKNFIFILSLVFSLSSFGQFNEIAFINNTNGDVEILLYFSGDGVLCESPNCGGASFEFQFTLSPGVTEIEEIDDLQDIQNAQNALITGGPNGICDTGFGCDFSEFLNNICNEVFYWDIVGFGHENWGFCCTGRVGDIDCGTNQTWLDNFIEVEWTEDANGNITVVLNNP